MKKSEILTFGKSIIHNELIEIQQLKENLHDNFASVVELIYDCKGKIVVVGVGKNAPIAQKMVATLNSTGTVAQFLHAGEAMHGDIGLVKSTDVCLVLSKSGNTTEIKSVLPALKEMSQTTVAICGNAASYLAINCDYFLNTTIQKEAGPENLAPTSSTTVQLVLCDAIAMSVKKLKNFTTTDFGKFHPGGMLGKQLLLRVQDMIDTSQKPQVDINAPIKEVIQSLSSGRFGITVVKDKNKICGVVTDGDLRRMLEKYSDLKDILAKDIATFNPKTIHQATLASKALQLINEYKIGQLIVVDDNDNYLGIVDFHSLTNEGIRAE